MPDPAGPSTLDRKLAAGLERLATADRAHRQAEATRLGLTPTQLAVLQHTARDTRSADTVGGLAALLDLRQPTVSDAVTTLVGKGLLARTTDPSDRRRQRLRPTTSGRRLAADATAFDDVVAAAIAALPDRVRQHPLELLVALLGRLHQDGVITVARMCSTCRFFQPDAHPTDDAPHHCTLLDTPLAGPDLRVDCPEHQPVNH
jgi:DNA-binding MarR family transcriptional regulator